MTIILIDSTTVIIQHVCSIFDDFFFSPNGQVELSLLLTFEADWNDDQTESENKIIKRPSSINSAAATSMPDFL